MIKGHKIQNLKLIALHTWNKVNINKRTYTTIIIRTNLHKAGEREKNVN